MKNEQQQQRYSLSLSVIPSLVSACQWFPAPLPYSNNTTHRNSAYCCVSYPGTAVAHLLVLHIINLP